jgi:uncharacterized membrane protein
MQGRLWEIDALRGIAVVGMILYHFSYDLAYFGFFDMWFFRSSLGLAVVHVGGALFIFLAGISLTLSYRKSVTYQSPRRKLFWKYLKRGVLIFSYGLAISFLTWIFVPEEMIVFGILHLIGVSIVLSYPFLRLKLPNVVLGISCIIVGLCLSNFTLDDPWLAWAGIAPSFFMLDYWPIFPWFGVVLLGIFVGNALYGDEIKGVGRLAPPLVGIRHVVFLGRHSLPVYLVHQPIILTALVLLGVVDTGVL